MAKSIKNLKHIENFWKELKLGVYKRNPRYIQQLKSFCKEQCDIPPELCESSAKTMGKDFKQ